jgi:hypothetical protein
MPRRRYTQADKAKVVALAEMKGQTVASEETGIPLTTINQWYHRAEYVELRTKTREDVADQFWASIQIALKAVVDGIEDGKLSEKAIALGVLYDKYALMTGGATGRTESRELNDLPDSAYVEAIHEAKRLAGVGSNGPDPAPPEEPAG